MLERLSTGQKVVFWACLFLGAMWFLAAVVPDPDFFEVAVLTPFAAIVVYLFIKGQDWSDIDAWRRERSMVQPQPIIVQVNMPETKTVATREAKPAAGKPTAVPMAYDPRKAHLLNDCCANCVNRSVCYPTQRALNEGMPDNPDMKWDYHCADYQRDEALTPDQGVDLGRKKGR